MLGHGIGAGTAAEAERGAGAEVAGEERGDDGWGGEGRRERGEGGSEGEGGGGVEGGAEEVWE